jgi:large subunit ribosomal protein L10
MEDKKIQQSKLDAVAGLKDQFGKSNGFFFADYRGLTVQKITELRRELAKSGGEIHIIKNNFAKIALRQIDVEGLDEVLKGPTAVALINDEAGPVAKVLVNFAKDKEIPFEIKGGYIEGGLYDKGQVEAFSKLPTRLELIQILMGTMKAPVQNFVLVANGVASKLVRTLAAVAESKES